MTNRIAGILAVLGASLALLISPFFAAGYNRAYEPGDSSYWIIQLVRLYPESFDFASRTWVYQIYGRIYAFFVPLTIPALLVLRKQISEPGRLSTWGWRVFFGGTLLGGLGIAAEYWSDPNGLFVLIGFGIDLLGTLLMWSGAILSGIATLRVGHVPRWIGYAFIGIPAGGILGFALLSHIPSGPWLGYAIFWLVLGIRLAAEPKQLSSV